MTAATSRAYWFFDDLVIVHVSGEETEERFSLLEVLSPPGDMTPLHVHRNESQTVYVLDGELTVYLPDGEHVLRRGDWIHQHAGVPQTERVTSSVPARALDVNSPAGFERFVVAVGRPAKTLSLPPPQESPPDIDEIAAIGAAHGLDILGPPGAMP